MGNLFRMATYAAAHYGKSLFWYMSELLLGFYLAEVFQIPPSAIASLLLVFLVWDALTDPLIGFWLARLSARTNSLLRMQAIGSIVSATVFTMVYWRPAAEDGAFVYALIVGLLFRSAYSIYDVPQNVLMRRLAVDSRNRFIMSSLRAAFSAIATLSVSLAIAWILSGSTHEETSRAYTIVAAVFATVAIGTATLLWRATRGLHLEGPAEKPPTAKDLARALNTPTIRNPCIAVFLMSIGWPLFGKLLPFFATYVLEREGMVGLLFSIMAIATAATQPIWVAVNRFADKTSMMALSLLAVWLSGAAFLAFATASTYSAMLSTAALAAASGLVSVVLWAYFADNLDRGENPVNDVFAFGLFTFCAKIGLGLSGFALGWTLEFSGYSPGMALAEPGKRQIVYTLALAPVVFASLAVIAVHYGRDRRDRMPPGERRSRIGPTSV